LQVGGVLVPTVDSRSQLVVIVRLLPERAVDAVGKTKLSIVAGTARLTRRRKGD